jgi:hypothetical protein
MMMEKLHFDIEIKASPEKVFKDMLADKTYREWTSEFNPSSRFEGSWEKNAKILFVGTSAEGKREGMVARIKENIPNQYISIEHYGLVNGDEEVTTGEEITAWAGSHENYTFKAVPEGTKLIIELDSNEEFKGYFEESWPRALAKLKSICERK